MTTKEQPTTPITEWHSRFSKALDVLADLAAFIACPPPNGDAPDRRLDLLFQVFRRLNPPVSDIRPAQSCSRRWADRVASPNARDNLMDLFLAALLSIDRAIANALDSGAESDTLIHVADFGDAGLRQLDSGMRLPDAGMQPLWMTVGLVDSLPKVHKLRSILAAEHLYLHASRDPAFVLGLTLPQGVPRPWYVLEEAVKLTKEFRTMQIRKAAEETEQRRQEEMRHKREFDASELGQLRQRLQVIERLEREGKIPVAPAPAPAVRRA